MASTSTAAWLNRVVNSSPRKRSTVAAVSAAVVNCTRPPPLHWRRKPRVPYSASNSRSNSPTAAGVISRAVAKRAGETGPLATNNKLSNCMRGVAPTTIPFTADDSDILTQNKAAGTSNKTTNRQPGIIPIISHPFPIGMYHVNTFTVCQR